MPHYDYKCSACGHKFELKQSFQDDPVAQCPCCQGKSRRILYAPPIIFKGSGFYITDHRKDPGDEKPKRAKPDDGEKAEAKTEAKAEAKTEAKPEAKAETKTDSSSSSFSGADKVASAKD